MQISHYLHTAILVTDLAKAETFYGSVLGLPKVERSLNFPGVWYQIGPIQIHLIVSQSVSSPQSEKWGRNAHLALAVEDLQEAKAALTEHGYPVQMSASGRAALFTQDPDGNVIELNQIG